MEKRQRIGMYSPYVPEHAGGGERHFFSVAEVLSQHHDVTVLVRSDRVDEASLRKKYEHAFHLDLSAVKFQKTMIGTAASSWKKILETAKYDVFYYHTDGSLFFSLARKNILHIQFPFTFPMIGLVNKLKLMNWGIRNANSQFTQKTVEHTWRAKIPYVLYPYVDSSIFKPLQKEKIILSVGRFFSGEKSEVHCKRQDVLVRVFKRMVDEGLVKGWKLVLIGSIDPGVDNVRYAKKVADLAQEYPVKIIHESTFDLLRQYYAHASIYWHAAGYDIDENKEPKKVEHFGISTIEAMSSQDVPVVIGKGGLKEIVQHGDNGFLWQTEEELMKETRLLIEDSSLMDTMQKKSRERAMFFSKEKFTETLKEMLE